MIYASSKLHRLNLVQKRHRIHLETIAYIYDLETSMCFTMWIRVDGDEIKNNYEIWSDAFFMKIQIVF